MRARASLHFGLPECKILTSPCQRCYFALSLVCLSKVSHMVVGAIIDLIIVSKPCKLFFFSVEYSPCGGCVAKGRDIHMVVVGTSRRFLFRFGEAATVLEAFIFPHKVENFFLSILQQHS